MQLSKEEEQLSEFILQFIETKIEIKNKQIDKFITYKIEFVINFQFAFYYNLKTKTLTRIDNGSITTDLTIDFNRFQRKIKLKKLNDFKN
jgi:hypothetical protein